MKSLRKKTITGILWSGIGQFGSQGIRYVVLLVLAGLLTPEDFGLIGVALIFVNFSEAIGQLGLMQAIVQKKEVNEREINSAFWANVAISLLLMALTILAATPITIFLGDERATKILQGLAIIFPITALSAVPRAILTRDLKFKQITMREFGGEIAYGVVGIFMALSGYGVWSLVGATISKRFVAMLALWIAVPWLPKLRFYWKELQGLLRFGLLTMLSALLNKGLSNVDYFVISRWLGAEALGFYTLAFQLAVVPLRRLVGILRRVAFPALSKVQSNNQRLQSGFSEGFRYLLLLTAPLTLLLVVLAPQFIEILYADKWEPTIRPLQILAVASCFYSFDMVESLYYAKGKPEYRVYVIAFRLLLFVGLVWAFGLSFGIIGVAYCLALSVLISAIISFIWAARLIDMSPLVLLKPLVPISAAVLIAATVVYLLQSAFVISIDSTLMLVVTAGILLVFYACATLVFMPSLTKQVGGIMRLYFGRKST